MAGDRGEPDELVYLELDDALEIYAAVIDAAADQGRDQLRSPEALKGALGRPPIYAHYEQADLVLQARGTRTRDRRDPAVVDGNKRTALVAMLTFLELNGQQAHATDVELADWIISFSRGVSVTQIAAAI